MSLALMSSLSGYFSGEYLLYTVVLLLFIPVTIAGIVAQVKVDSTFRKCNVPASCGLTAAQIARRMLDANGLTNVQVVRIGGHLTDNYNPVTKVLSLSQSVYGSTSVSAIGVACHEAGHAVQHARKFVFATLRLRLVPVLNFANRALFPILLIGMLLGLASPYSTVGSVFIWIGVVLFGLSLLFSLFTLSTEFDASRRAQEAIRASFLTDDEAKLSRKVLTAAAMTYVVSFLTSLLQFLRFFALLLMSRRRN